MEKEKKTSTMLRAHFPSLEPLLLALTRYPFGEGPGGGEYLMQLPARAGHGKSREGKGRKKVQTGKGTTRGTRRLASSTPHPSRAQRKCNIHPRPLMDSPPIDFGATRPLDM